jgi:hypothetical protein
VTTNSPVAHRTITTSLQKISKTQRIKRAGKADEERKADEDKHTGYEES